MAKGLSLEQFKNELESDATKRCSAQEKTIKELNEQLKAKDKLINQLENRCFVTSRGILCIFCGVKNECKAWK